MYCPYQKLMKAVFPTHFQVDPPCCWDKTKQKNSSFLFPAPDSLFSSEIKFLDKLMGQAFLEMAIILTLIAVIAPRFGSYIAKVFEGGKSLLDPMMSPLERVIFVAAGIRHSPMMTGWQYLKALLATNILMGMLVFGLLVTQRHLPLNPMKIVGMRWDLALHTTISFLTNTGQQHYVGEKALSYFSQTSAIAFLMFTATATGLAVGIACIRGFTGQPLGNFYVDLTKAITRILLPLSLVGAIALLALGVPETFAPPLEVTTLEGVVQFIARGPVASFESIKLLGGSGGGFFAANSAHPYENPSSASNFLELMMMLLIPTALIHTYGILANQRKQSRVLFWLLVSLFVVLTGIALISESQGNPLINSRIGMEQPSLEGKEMRFGWVDSTIWSVVATTTMSGAVNSMHDSLMPGTIFSSFVGMFLRIIWGGQGMGIAYLLILAMLAAFLMSLLAGRTPEFLGRKIEQRELQLISMTLLIHPFVILIPSAIAFIFPEAFPGISNPGFHGLSQVIYEYTSGATNNGSRLAGLASNTLWWNLTTSLCILLGRFVPIMTIILLADSMARKPQLTETEVILNSNTGLFISVTILLSIMISFLSFFPVLALGPLAEGFKMASGIR